MYNYMLRTVLVVVDPALECEQKLPNKCLVLTDGPLVSSSIGEVSVNYEEPAAINDVQRPLNADVLSTSGAPLS